MTINNSILTSLKEHFKEQICLYYIFSYYYFVFVEDDDGDDDEDHNDYNYQRDQSRGPIGQTGLSTAANIGNFGVRFTREPDIPSAGNVTAAVVYTTASNSLV